MRPITHVIAEYNLGKFADECSAELNQLVGECTATGKKGELTIKSKLAPAKSADRALLVTMEAVVKTPEFSSPAEYAYVNKDNDLVRDNPAQQRLELREVTRTPMPVFDPETGEIIEPAAEQQQRAG